MARKRDYKKELAQEGPHRVKDRVARNRSRQRAIASGKAAVGDGKVQHHPKPLSRGGSRKAKTVTQSKSASNREGGRMRKGR